MKAQTYTIQYLACPHCSGESGHRIDHLLNNGRRSFGPWYCEACGGAYNGVSNGSEIELQLLDDQKVTTLDLLVLPPQQKPVYFVISGMGFRKMGQVTDFDGKEYFYNEHSCPTNWLRDIERLIVEDDDDPHGLLEFVRSVDWESAEMREMGAGQSEPDVFATFPEISQGSDIS